MVQGIVRKFIQLEHPKLTAQNVCIAPHNNALSQATYTHSNKPSEQCDVWIPVNYYLNVK